MELTRGLRPGNARSAPMAPTDSVRWEPLLFPGEGPDMKALEALVGSENARMAGWLAEDRGWTSAEVAGRLAAVGGNVRRRLGEQPASRRRYLKTAVGLQETLRRSERLAPAQCDLEALEAALESEAALLTERREPEASGVGRAQAVVAKGRPPEDPATEQLRAACHWGLAELRYDDEVAAATMRPISCGGAPRRVGGTLLELGKVPLHGGAVVRLAGVLPHGDAAAPDVDAVHNGGKPLAAVSDVCREKPEFVGGAVGGEVAPKVPERDGRQIQPVQRRAQPADLSAVSLGSRQEQRRFLKLVVQPIRAGKLLPHAAHAVGKSCHRRAQAGSLQVSHHGLPAGDRRHIRERDAEEGIELILLPARRHDREELIQVEIGEVGGIPGLRRHRPLEEDALKRHWHPSRPPGDALTRPARARRRPSPPPPRRGGPPRAWPPRRPPRRTGRGGP